MFVFVFAKKLTSISLAIVLAPGPSGNTKLAGQNAGTLLLSLPTVSCNFIFFFCTDPRTSRDLIEQIMESSELVFLEIFPL